MKASSKKIVEILDKENIDAKEFSKKIGVTAFAVSQWMSDQTSPRASHLIKIAQSYRNVNFYWLIGMEDNYERNTPQNLLIRKVNELQKRIELYEKYFKLTTD